MQGIIRNAIKKDLLLFGIPALVAHNWLSGRADRIIFDLEFYASKVLDSLRRRSLARDAQKQSVS